MSTLFLFAALGAEPVLSIPFESYTLDNGLKVVLHEDHSDPIVAIATVVHVGSNREEPGKTGFAHFFEHMAFNDSENVPRGANRKRIEELGGRRNGGTWRDGTIYYEVVPRDALEKLLWIDSDRLGYMINTVTVGALENEKQVVKNEKRERNDNAPYGFTREVVAKELFPEGHPYSWSVIGSLEDLQAATLDDVRAFYETWYGPNNATLVLAGDFEIEPTKKLIAQYFGEIPRGPDVVVAEARPVTLDASKRVMHEDSFAKVPEIQLHWPTVPEYHSDAAPLMVLGDLLYDGRRAPLFRVIVQGGLAPSADAWQRSDELTGTFTVRVRAHDGTDLDDVLAAIDGAMADFAANEFSDADLTRIKAEVETSFYRDIASVLDKARSLASSNEFAGDPGHGTKDLAALKAVTREDVMRVFGRYLNGRHRVVTSFVPKGQPALSVEDSRVAAVSVEQVVKGAEATPAEEVAEVEGSYERTPTVFDRSAEPALGDPGTWNPPTVWRAQTRKGMPIYGIAYDELPLVEFSFVVQGGHRLDPAGKAGTARLMAQLMNEGTRSKTPEQLEDAIGQLGASLRIRADRDRLIVEGTCLADRYEALMAIATEMVLEPRWDPVEFERLKASQLTLIQQRLGRGTSVAYTVFNRVLYGDGHPYATPAIGTLESAPTLTLKDLTAFYKRNLSRRVSAFHVVGPISEAQAVASVEPLARGLGNRAVELPTAPVPTRSEPEVFFIDVPGSKQTVIRMGSLAVEGADPRVFDIKASLDRLGSGSSSRLFQILRIQKGYTYGAYAGMGRRAMAAPIYVQSSVRANVTGESLAILQEQIAAYDDTFTADDLATTKNLLLKRDALNFETLGQRLAHLEDLSAYGLAPNELSQQAARLEAMTLAEVKATLASHLDGERMVVVLVGDAEMQLEEVSEVYGEPVLLDVEGAPIP